MSDIQRFYFDPKEFCTIRLDHYIELARAQRLVETIAEHSKLSVDELYRIYLLKGVMKSE